MPNRRTVLHQHVSVEKLASLDLATVGGRVGSGVVGLSLTGSSTLGNVKGSLLEDTDTEVAG